MWPNPQFTADLVIFIGEILNGKLPFLCSVPFSGIELSATKLMGNFDFLLCYFPSESRTGTYFLNSKTSF